MNDGGSAKKWLPVVVLGLAQFIMVLDTTVMNVSISAVVKDLDTTVAGVQLAITAYALVMAAFMLTGGRIGDKVGRRRAFAIGLGIYGVGSLITSLAPNLGVLLIGWSLVEGLGATLVIPAIMALTAATYSGRDRLLAYGILGGIAGAGAAAGPLIGGWVTTTLSWRYVFAAETVVVVLLLAGGLRFLAAPKPSGGRIAVGEVLMTASSMALIVLGVLKASSWGFLLPANPPVIGGVTIEPLGLSPTPFVVGAGVVLMFIYMHLARAKEARGESPLVSPSLLDRPRLRAGLLVVLMVQLVIGGVFFTLPVFLQVTLEKDALETGIQLVPLSVALIVASLAGPRIALKHSPKLVVRIGFAVAGIGLCVITAFVSDDFLKPGFVIGMAVTGAGLGLVMSQIGSLVMNSVSEKSTGEAGGMQGTAQNLGMSLGTALIGAILLAGLTTGFNERIAASASVTPEVKQLVASQTEAGVQIVSESDAIHYAEQQGLAPDQVSAVANEYSDAQVEALRRSIAFIAIFAFGALIVTRRLPIETGDESVQDELQTAAA
ncbi:MAG: MFS transporter [Solirubrobacterales bacterium]|nr:MFS transporter [Solirubrobacterales bacterium]